MFRPVCFLALLCLSAVAAEIEFKHVIHSESVLITLNDPEFHVVSAPELRQFNWASVNVFGTQTGVVTPDCESNQRELRDLGEVERRLLESVTERLRTAQTQNGFTRMQLGGGEVIVTGDPLPKSALYSFQEGQVRLQKVGDEHYLVRSQKLESQSIKWLILDRHLVTFVYLDGRSIRMQPHACLDEQKLQLLNDVHQELIDTFAEMQRDWWVLHEHHMERLGRDWNERNESAQISHDNQVNRLVEYHDKRAKEESSTLDYLIDQKEKDYESVKSKLQRQHDHRIAQIETDIRQQKHEAPEQTIEQLKEDFQVKLESLEKNHAEQIDQMLRDHAIKFVTNLKVELDRLKKDFSEREVREAERKKELMDRMRIQFEQHNKQMESEFRQALNTETWTSMIRA